MLKTFKIPLACLLIFSFTIPLKSKPLPVKTENSVIIDTDCAIDDMRAISLLLSRPEVNIKAVLLSDGSLPPAEGLQKISALLHSFSSEHIPVGLAVPTEGIGPPWREFNRNLSWGKQPPKTTDAADAVILLQKELVRSDDKMTLVCLGTLTNVCNALKKDASLTSRIERIVWYNESVNPLKGFNYEYDNTSADFVLQAGIRIDVISNLHKPQALLDTSFISLCSNSDNLLAGALFYVHSQPPAFERLANQHFYLSDDLVGLYITNSELFDMVPLKDRLSIRYNQDYQINALKEALNDMIRGIYKPGKGVVLSEFPVNREYYTYDVRQIMDSAISRHGTVEWKAVVMTDEFHGHLGVFSIVGAKMGIKAREIFNVGPDELEVVSFAGSMPPYSCLNDGIQVSTGATLGMGTIKLADDSITRPEAIFSHDDESVMITLKPEYLKQVNQDIREGIVKFGLMDEGYWKLIRSNALDYWLNWDRNEIFTITEIKK